MTYVIIIVCIVVFLLAVKLYSFFQRGGTFTQVTRNVSYLYFQARLVYPKLAEDAVRYIAILINSSTNRSHFTRDRIKQLVLSYSGDDWTSLCTKYSWEYSSSCGGPSPLSIPPDIISEYNEKILQTISWVENQVKHGKTRKDCELVLRGMSQQEVIDVVLELEAFK
jgi:hypothetical protein